VTDTETARMKTTYAVVGNQKLAYIAKCPENACK